MRTRTVSRARSRALPCRAPWSVETLASGQAQSRLQGPGGWSEAQGSQGAVCSHPGPAHPCLPLRTRLPGSPTCRLAENWKMAEMGAVNRPEARLSPDPLRKARWAVGCGAAGKWLALAGAHLTVGRKVGSNWPHPPGTRSQGWMVPRAPRAENLPVPTTMPWCMAGLFLGHPARALSLSHSQPGSPAAPPGSSGPPAWDPSAGSGKPQPPVAGHPPGAAMCPAVLRTVAPWPLWGRRRCEVRSLPA